MKIDLKTTFQNKVILVTGGSGSIGSEITRQLLKFKPKQVRIFSRDESRQFFLQQEMEQKGFKDEVRYLIGDVRDKERLDRAVLKTDIIFHAAALKHVPFCEYNPFEAVKTNVNGTQNIIDLAIKHNVEKFIGISTDKAVYPNTIMGTTKLLMEKMIVGAANYLGDARTKFSVVRFGNVLNSRGSVIPLWEQQIENGGPITVTHKNMKRFFMKIKDAVGLVFLATSIMQGEEIFVFKMKEENIFKLAKKIIKKHKKKISIKFIGPREKEKMEERLFTEEERPFLLDRKEFYVILPNKETFGKRKFSYKAYGVND